jgi:hypothetical protein
MKFVKGRGVLKSILQNGYAGKKQKSNVEGFTRDESLSGQRAQVYVNPQTGKAIVNHRGTQGFQDVITDAKLLFNPKAYRKSKRYKHAQKIQKEAEAKYGAENLTTTGHSLGARLASDLGKNTSHVVTYNKPVIPSDYGKSANPNETHIRTKYDPVSILAPLLDKTKTQTVKSNSLLGSHSTEQLSNLKNEPIVGGWRIRRRAFINHSVII